MNLHTKKDFEDLMFRILNPLKDKYSKGCASLEVGITEAWYSTNVAKMEAFARPLWGLIPFWNGNGENMEFEHIYKKGIVSGTTPDGDEYWGKCTDFDQRFVEMAALSYGLLFAPDKLWTPLTELQKENFSKWLYQINDLRVPGSNWLFFRVLVNVALKKCGMKYSEEKLSIDLAQLEEFYVGNGWYSDGLNDRGAQKDYYIAFAIHFYSLIYAKVMDKEDPERAKLYKDRAMEFGKEFIYWFADSGEAVPYGRSMTYRFAQVAFWSMCLLTDVLPFSIGIIKGIIVRNLEYWLSDNNIFDNGSILTIGYKYSQQIMSERYNAPGSPYWCMKSFAFMMLPESHEFWKCKPLPLPELKQISVQKESELMIGRYQGAVTLYPAGTLNIFPDIMRHKYLKFTYSTRFGFSIPRSDWQFDSAAPDGTLAFEIEGRIFTRIKNRGFSISEDRLLIEWSPGFGIEVMTEIIPTKTGHIRKHKISSPVDCVAYDSGFAVDARKDVIIESGKNFASVQNQGSYCSISSEYGTCEVKDVVPNTNLISPKTVIPTVMYNIQTGINRVVSEIKEILPD